MMFSSHGSTAVLEQVQVPSQHDMMAVLERATASALPPSYEPRHRADVPADTESAVA